LDDLQRALGWMEAETGARRFVLAGLCSGADLAFTAARHPGVAGVVMMNPRTFCLHELQKVESWKGARWYQESMHRKESWAKLFRGEVNLVRVARAVAPKAAQLIGRKVRGLVARGAGSGRGGDRRRPLRALPQRSAFDRRRLGPQQLSAGARPRDRGHGGGLRAAGARAAARPAGGGGLAAGRLSGL